MGQGTAVILTTQKSIYDRDPESDTKLVDLRPACPCYRTRVVFCFCSSEKGFIAQAGFEFLLPPPRLEMISLFNHV